MIRAISLDFWGTLAVYNPEYSEARTKYLAELFGVEETNANARYKGIKRQLDQEAENFGSATTPLVAVKSLLEGLYLSRKTNAVEVMNDLHALARRHMPIMGDDIRDALTEAASLFTLCITSNTNFIGGEILRHLLYGIPIHHFSFSDEAGLSKPDPDFFRLTVWGAQRRIPDLRITEMIHIGDHMKCDIEGAQRLGMLTAFTQSPKQTAHMVRQIIKRPMEVPK